MTQPMRDTSAETLRFSHGDTALGTIIVAESVRGVTALFIGDDRMKLLRDLKDAFPSAEAVFDPAGLRPTHRRGGRTTYGAIANALPMAVSAQEVGAACAANHIAVAVPCHRVVKADGSISGYRWGVHRKRRLINMEGVALWSSICA